MQDSSLFSNFNFQLSLLLLQAADEGFLQQQAEDLVREEAEVDGANGGDGQNDVDGDRKRNGRGSGGLFAGVTHVHGNNYSEVVVGADDAVNGHQNRQPDQVGIDG